MNKNNSKSGTGNPARKWMPLWTLPLLLAFAVGTIWLRLAVVRATYEIHQSERTMQKLRLEREQAELRLAGLRSPRRLEALARTRYGLAQPKVEQVVYLK